jgi:general L-amino acid transport system permease protein
MRNTDVLQSTGSPINSRPAPVHSQSAMDWLRANLFSDWKNSLLTLAVLSVLVVILPKIYEWGIANAVFSADLKACQALDNSGACWGMIAEKFRLIFFGRYAYEEQWRPLAATLLMLAALTASCYRPFWNRWLLLVWPLVVLAFILLMRGGVLGLARVDSNLWGGFPLTLFLSVVGIALAFPLAVLVALGRRSRLTVIRVLCVFYIELIRGVPLITVLFMASFLFPLFLPAGFGIDVLVRVQVGIILFAAAYLAEIIRGGMQAIPKGQYEAAAAIGLSYWQTVRKVLLPQALRKVVPPLVNTFISMFKDTSLVVIVSLYELTGALRLALGDANWRPFFMEGYLFIASAYFVCCYSMSRYSRWVEKYLSAGRESY